MIGGATDADLGCTDQDLSGQLQDAVNWTKWWEHKEQSNAALIDAIQNDNI